LRRIRHAQAEDGSGDTDEDMMQKAMHQKAEKNLDIAGIKKSALFIKFFDSQISSNLNSVGISLGSHLISPKRIYFSEHFCYCFSSNLCVLNATNKD
jgi:hypothetical protein